MAEVKPSEVNLRHRSLVPTLRPISELYIQPQLEPVLTMRYSKGFNRCSSSLILDLKVELRRGRERSLCHESDPWPPEERAESTLPHRRVSLQEKAGTVSQTLNTLI